MAEITVYNYSGLKSALTDAASKVIILGADIGFDTTGGVTVPRTKGEITIDGAGHVITDYASAASGDAIRIADTAGAFTLTIRNVTWSGRNYFGVAYCPTGANGAAVTLILDNVSYTGPQAIYNRRGVTRVKDSMFLISRNTGTINPEEFAEANRVFIEGRVTVNSLAASDSVIWFLNADAALTVEENAVFDITTTNYAFFMSVNPIITLRAGSTTTVHTKIGLYNSPSATTHMAREFIMERGASFKAAQTTRSSVPSFKVGSLFVMEEDSSFYLAAEASGTASLMYFAERAEARFTNPRSAVLYNNGGKAIEFETGTAANSNLVTIDAELFNLWSDAALFPLAGTLDDPPEKAFLKADGSNVTAEIRASSSDVTQVQSNIADEDKGYPMTAATLPLLSAEVISIGRLPLALDEINDLSTSIDGVTEPDAAVRAVFNGETVNGAADGEGAFSLAITPVSAGTAVDFFANVPFLTKEINRRAKGSVSITRVDDLYFRNFVAPSRKPTVFRRDGDWYIEVTDTRLSGGNWYLYAYIESPMHSETDVLPNALTFSYGAYSDIMSVLPVLVYSGAWSHPPAVTRISWEEAEGFLLKIVPGFPYYKGRYSTSINWFISEGFI